MSDPSPRSPDLQGGVEASAELAASLAQARERLAFYESFDTVIQDNIRQAGELLRTVAAERERTEQRLAAMQREVDAKLAAQATVLRALAASLGGLQDNVATINQQVGEALSQLEAASPAALAAGPPAGDEISRVESPPVVTAAPAESLHAPAFGHSDVRQRDGGVLIEGAAAASPLLIGRGEMPDSNVAGDSVTPAKGAPATPSAAEDPEGSAAAETAPAVGETGDLAADGRGAMAARVPGPDGDSPSEQPVRRRLDLVIRGVPRAAAALSIQRYLQDLPTIEAVEVREYVAGVLRFQLEAAAFDPVVLAGWGAEAPAAVIAATDQVVELQYPE